MTKRVLRENRGDLHAVCFIHFVTLELGRFTIQIRDYDSKSHFLMCCESLIQFSIESNQFLNRIFDKFDSNS